jgi:hypothetical protein
MFKQISIILFSGIALLSCTEEVDTCTCWEELVTRAENQEISSSCEYILEMTIEEISAEAGPECVEKINTLLFGDDDIELEEELDENAMFEEVENIEQ